MIPRRWRSAHFRWKPFLLACGVIYVFLSFLSYFSSDLHDPSSNSNSIKLIKGNETAAAAQIPMGVNKEQIINKPDDVGLQRPNPKIIRPLEKKPEGEEPYYFKLNYNNKDIYIEKLLTRPNANSLMEKTVLDPALIKSKKRLISVDAGFNQDNLGGCPDWNCEMSYSSDMDKADVLIMQSPRDFARKPHQLVVYYSQESPRNSASLSSHNTFYNMTLGFRHDSPGASPYGYAVKLAPQSRLSDSEPTVNESIVQGKTKGAAWYVSHCGTQSNREKLVKQLQNYIDVDIYGSCGPLRCAKGTDCENSINKDYHFYMALENSICEDYITEKLWNQGYGHTVIPVVLKRSIIEDYVPPNSFIAFDDYENIQKMGEHMKMLMTNKKEYMKYFDWRRDYEVIYLNGLKHDALERPWGFCQLCRIAHILSSDASAKVAFMDNSNLGVNWDNSCESDGSLANKLLFSSNGGAEVMQKKDSGLNGQDTLVTSAMRVKN